MFGKDAGRSEARWRKRPGSWAIRDKGGAGVRGREGGKVARQGTVSEQKSGASSS